MRPVAALAVIFVACGDSSGGPPPACAAMAPVVIAASASGQLAMLDGASPGPVLASVDLAAPVARLRLGQGHVFVVHPAPRNAISVLDPADLSLQRTLELGAGDPRDVLVVDAHTAVVTLHDGDSLATIDPTDLMVRQQRIPLGGSGGDSLVACGAGYAVSLADRIVLVRGTTVTPVVTLGAPRLDLVCQDGQLYVPEPTPVALGTGGVERIDVASATSQGFFVSEGQIGGETGPLVLTGQATGWMAMHTEFGPGPSSHLVAIPGDGSGGRWDTFVQVDSLAALGRNVYLPDACTSCTHAAGLAVFDAISGAPRTATPLDVGFAPTVVAAGVPCD